MAISQERQPLPKYATPSIERSKNMAAIRGQDTQPEMLVRHALHSAGFRFRLHRRDLPGTPDIVLPRFRIAVMVHGCFWHGHDCKAKHVPKTNTPYWSAKIARNVERDAKNAAALERGGWHVVTIWQCSLTEDTDRLLAMLDRLRSSNK